jgi:hypothetical protein
VFQSTWHRASKPGWQLWLYRISAVGWAVLVVYSLQYTMSLEPDAYTMWVSLVYWIALIWSGLVLWRVMCLGVFAGPRGIRIEWLSRHRVIPWREIHSIQVAASPLALRGRMRRVVIQTTRGEHVPVQGTDEIMRWLFHADSPEMVRHRLERERRFFLGKKLPRRVPGLPTPEVIDLRQASPRRGAAQITSEARAAGA